MPTHHVNYDQIASTYHRRYEVNKLAGVVAALWNLVKDREARQVLEVGCGTGRWLTELQPVVPRLYGLDLSGGMLQQARKTRQPALVQGRAERLPWPNQTFDLIFCVNALHHFNRPQGFVTEAQRLLRPGGSLAIVGMDPRTHRHDWYIYDYFERTFEADLNRFPSWCAVRDWLVAANFSQVEWRPVARVLDHKIGRAVLADPFLQKNAASQLSLLTDEAYAAGMGRIEAAIAVSEAAGETLTFPVDLSLAILTGQSHIA
jgi:ubiquinone/menaquinone biosynthesis C-methylase UbiE